MNFTKYVLIAIVLTNLETVLAKTSTPKPAKYRKRENTRFLDSYDQYNNISVEECLSKCTADIRCKAVSFLHDDRHPDFGWYPGFDICFVYASSKPTKSKWGKEFFTSFVRSARHPGLPSSDQTTSNKTSTTIDPNSKSENNNFEKFENTRFLGSYDAYLGIPIEECLSKCAADILCKAVSFLHDDRNPDFGWYEGVNACFVYASSNPDSSSIGETYFTSYIRVINEGNPSRTSTTIDPNSKTDSTTIDPNSKTDLTKMATNSMIENNKYEELEFTKFVNEYKEFKNIFSAEECLNKCTADIRCRAVTLFHSDRVPYFNWSWDDGLETCFLFDSSNPATTYIGKNYYTSYIRR